MKTIYSFIKKTLVLGFTLFFINFYAQSVATYNITFTSVWNATDHGTLPNGAHWSHLIGANHNVENDFLEMGTQATLGVENVAEIGNNVAFTNEINTRINSNTAQQLIDMSSLNTATGSITIANLEINQQYPLLTLISMIAPSPDWFIALNSYDLRQGGNWVTSANFDLFPYDAGTENGSNYSTNNSATSPQSTITSLVNVAPFNDQRIGFFTITLISTLSTETALLNNTISVYPNPSKGIITFSNLNADFESIEVYNIIGKQLLSKKLTANETSKTLDLSELQSGIYLVKVIANNGEFDVTRKIVLR